jgi:hypothetical protein
MIELMINIAAIMINIAGEESAAKNEPSGGRQTYQGANQRGLAGRARIPPRCSVVFFGMSKDLRSEPEIISNDHELLMIMNTQVRR